MKTEIKLEDNENVEYECNLKIQDIKNIKPVKNSKNAKKKINTQIEQVQSPLLNENVYIEYILMDLKNFEELHKFKDMKSLALINQNIKDMEFLISLTTLNQLEYLCLNENFIENLRFLEKAINLRDIQLNFNLIKKIEFIENLQNLEKFWISANQISKIENLPPSLLSFYICCNCVENIDECMPERLPNITELNISGNFISKFDCVYILSKIKNLTNLSLQDPDFGENPICRINNYRIFILHNLPKLTHLDQKSILEDELKEVSSTFFKKTLYYKNKIKNNNKITKSIFKLLKNFKTCFEAIKKFQIMFFTLRIKMLEYVEYENKLESNINEGQKYLEMRKELENSTEKMSKCEKSLESINMHYSILKNYISEVNDLMIVK
jgi:hypothetical protein